MSIHFHTHAPFLLTSFTVDSDSARGRFRARVTLHDLRVNLGSWQPTADFPSPPWYLLQRAPIWTRVDERSINIRDNVSRSVAPLESVAGGTDSLRSWNITMMGQPPITASIVIATSPPGQPAKITDNVRHLVYDLAFAHADGRPLPDHVRQVAREAKPVVIWATAPTPFDAAMAEISRENPEPRWYTWDTYVQPAQPLQFNRYLHQRRYFGIFALETQMQFQVSASPPMIASTLVSLH